MRLAVVASGSRGNCYILKDNDNYLMLDCGEYVKWSDVLAGCDFMIGNVDALLVTHWHRDHLPNTRKIQRMGIPVYGCDELESFTKLTQGESIHGIQAKHITKIANRWKVVPWYVPHSGNDNENVPCFAYYIESPSGHKTVYITDFMYSPVTFKSWNVNTILVACNHDDELDEEENEAKIRHIVSGHSSLSTVNELIRVNQTESLRNVILCHLSSDNATPSVMRETIQQTCGDNVTVNIATKGKTIELKER